MRRVLFAALALIAICAVVAAAEKLSREANLKIAGIETALRKRLGEKPPGFHELCRFELARHEEREEGLDERMEYLESLYCLRQGLRKGIKKLNPYWRPKEPVLPEEREYEYVHREYDISDIVSEAPDRPAPVIGFGRGPFLKGSTTRTGPKDEGPLHLGDDDESVGVGFCWETIMDLIERVLGDDGYGHEFRLIGGRLICRITEEQAKVIEELLAQLRKNAGLSVKMEVRFLRTTDSYLRKLRDGAGKSAIYLSAEAEKRLLTDAARKTDVEMVASSEVIASEGQVIHIREGRQVSMLMDYDVCAPGVASLQPVVKLVNEGLICQLRPAVVRGAKWVSIDILASISAIRKDTRKGEFLGGELMLPVMDMSLVRTAVRVPAGTAVLVGGTTANSGAGIKDSREFVVFIKPVIERKKK